MGPLILAVTIVVGLPVMGWLALKEFGRRPPVPPCGNGIAAAATPSGRLHRGPYAPRPPAGLSRLAKIQAAHDWHLALYVEADA